MGIILSLADARAAYPGPHRRFTVNFAVRESEERGKEVLLGLKGEKIGAGLWNGTGGGEEEKDKGSIRRTNYRETKEESTLRLLRFHRVAEFAFYHPHAPKWNMVCRMFRATAWSGQEEADGREILEYRWFPEDTLPAKMWESDKLWLPRMFKGEVLEGGFLFSPDGGIVEHELRTVGSWRTRY